jgi:hypothetical protein
MLLRASITYLRVTIMMRSAPARPFRWDSRRNLIVAVQLVSGQYLPRTPKLNGHGFLRKRGLSAPQRSRLEGSELVRNLQGRRLSA